MLSAFSHGVCGHSTTALAITHKRTAPVRYSRQAHAGAVSRGNAGAPFTECLGYPRFRNRDMVISSSMEARLLPEENWDNFWSRYKTPT